MTEKENIILNESERHIMECLWLQSPLTVMQLVRSLSHKVGWAKSTVTTLVSRMEAKGLIYYQEGTKAREYYPAISREAAAISETESLLSRVYKGSVGMMMNTLVEKKSLSRDEIQELYEILRRAEEEQK